MFPGIWKYAQNNIFCCKFGKSANNFFLLQIGKNAPDKMIEGIFCVCYPDEHYSYRHHVHHHQDHVYLHRSCSRGMESARRWRGRRQTRWSREGSPGCFPMSPSQQVLLGNKNVQDISKCTENKRKIGIKNMRPVVFRRSSVLRSSSCRALHSWLPPSSSYTAWWGGTSSSTVTPLLVGIHDLLKLPHHR